VEYQRQDKGILTAVITLPAGLTGEFIVKNVHKQLHSGRQVIQVPETANKEK
jgi:hypothetical protein